MEEARYIFDIETDGLIDDVTTIHSLVLKDIDTQQVYSYASDKSHNSIKNGLDKLVNSKVIVGFNSIRFDIPVLFKLFPSLDETRLLDVLHLDLLVCSRLIWTDMYERDIKQGKTPPSLRGRHSLKSWGYRLGMLKGEMEKEDFSKWTQELQTYCDRDVEISY